MPHQQGWLLKLEDQGFDGNRHGAGRLQDPPQVDEVEVPQDDPIDGEDVVLEAELLCQDSAYQPGQVVVEDQVDGPPAPQGAGQALHHAAAEGGDTYGGGGPSPAEHQSHFGHSLFQVEGLEVVPDALGHRWDVNVAAEVQGRPQH